jgi:hypothetical protein
MKGKKKVTKAVLDANRANAKKSTGPRTPAGKLRAKFSALTHGFFAGELVLNDEEKRQLETIRSALYPQLAPTTIMQDLKFAEIMADIGRCKVALRLEMRHIRRVLGQDSAEQVEDDQLERPGARPDWYLSGRQGLCQGIRLLEAVKQEFLHLGRLDEKWNTLLDEAFGPQLRQLLTQWVPSHPDATTLAYHLTKHAETYKKPLPPLGGKRESAEDGENEPVAIPDPEQMKHMVLKLIELEESMLSDLWKSVEERASTSDRERNDIVDAPRYFSTACRDLDRAIDRFMYLKKNNL